MKKASIGRKMYDVISEQEYVRRWKYNPEITKDLADDTAVEKGDYIYPLIAPNDKTVGISSVGPVMFYNHPKTEEQKEMYSSKHVIDFENNPGGLKERIEKQAQYEATEKKILISKDNIYTVSIDEQDAPEMKLFKTALNKKNIDIVSYKPRFSSDYSNDVRVIQGDSITFPKLKKLASILDMEVELTIRDKKDIANPIGEELSVIINE